MKNEMKIAIATDFTDAADNAVNYVHAVLNKDVLDAQPHYLFVHAFKPLTPYSNTPSMPVIRNDELERVLKQKLDKLQADIASKLSDSQFVSQVFARGSVNEVLSDVVKDAKVQLIVMGSRGKGAFTRMTVGSNTLEVANTVDCPLLAIPDKEIPHRLSKITLATSLGGQSLSKRSIELLERLVDGGKVALEVIHVFDREVPDDVEASMKSSQIHHQLSNLSHTHRHLEGDDIADTLSEYIAEHQPDLVAMAPSEKSLFDKIFHQSKTEKMIYHEGMPTLILT